LQTQEIGKDMTDSEKYEMIGKLIDNPTRHDMARAFSACSIQRGSVCFIDDGIQVEDHARSSSVVGGTDMPVAAEHIEDIDMTVAGFYKMLTELVDAGGMESSWPGKIRICFHIRGWTNLPVE
jgi:hypothetical protein